MADSIILAGAGGHCKSCIEVIEAAGYYTIKGILDAKTPAGSKLLNYEVLGGDEMISELAGMANNYFLITVGQIESSAIRLTIAQVIKKAGGKFATVVDPGARISNSSQLGAGSIAMQQVIVNSSCRIGEQAILNNKCLIEHDTVIGDYCHISTGVIINGGCTIRDHVFIGSGAVIINNITIGSNVVIGAGAVVHTSITEPGVYAGNPVRKISGVNA